MLDKTKYSWGPVSCWCGRVGKVLFAEKTRDGIPLKFWRCLACETVYASPYMVELEAFYASDFERGRAAMNFIERLLYCIDILRHGFPRLPAEEQWEFIRTGGVEPQRVLDVGCGQLQFLIASGLSWDGLRGTDLHIDFGEAQPPYDLICFAHSLEHMRWPLETLTARLKELSPNGLVFLETPHFDNSRSRLTVPHLWNWNYAAFCRFLREAGLEVLKEDLSYHWRFLCKRHVR